MTTTASPYSPGEVAEIFGVDPKTVARWAKSGRLEHFRTPGGHVRFPREAVDTMRAGSTRERVTA